MVSSQVSRMAVRTFARCLPDFFLMPIFRADALARSQIQVHAKAAAAYARIQDLDVESHILQGDFEAHLLGLYVELPGPPRVARPAHTRECTPNADADNDLSSATHPN